MARCYRDLLVKLGIASKHSCSKDCMYTARELSRFITRLQTNRIVWHVRNKSPAKCRQSGLQSSIQKHVQQQSCGLTTNAYNFFIRFCSCMWQKRMDTREMSRNVMNTFTHRSCSLWRIENKSPVPAERRCRTRVLQRRWHYFRTKGSSHGRND